MWLAKLYTFGLSLSQSCKKKAICLADSNVHQVAQAVGQFFHYASAFQTQSGYQETTFPQRLAVLVV